MRVCDFLITMKKLFLQIILMISIVSMCSGVTNEFWFPVGEKLVYRLYWGIIPVGTCYITTEWAELEGKSVLSIKATAETGAVVSKIYPVNDFIETRIDPGTFLPREYIQKLREGRHIRDDCVTFNHAEGIAIWRSTKESVTNEAKKIMIEATTRDVLCLAYYMRSKGLSVGQTEKFRVLVDDKIYDLEVMGLGYETMDVGDFNNVKCLVVEPKAAFGGIFVRKGRVNLWFSEDMRRICTRMTGKLSFANLKAILTGVEGPGDDAWSKNAANVKRNSNAAEER